MIIVAEILLGMLVYAEYKNYKVLATPVTILGGIYFLFILMINTFGRSLGFLKVKDYTIMSFTFFIFILFLSGCGFSIYYRQRTKVAKISRFDLNAKLKKREKSIWYLFVFSLICYVISLLQVIQRYGINNTKSMAFGPFAHIGFLSRCLLPVILYYVIRTRKIKYIIGSIINIIALIMFQGKYHLYIPIAGFIILYLITKEKINLKKILVVVFIAFLVALILFVSVYTIIPNILASETSWDSMSEGIVFSTRHFFHYLFCPFICSNEYFANPIYRTLEEGIRTNFNPIDTLLQQFIGNRDFFSPVITMWPVVDELGTTANVGGLFSESVLNIGYPLSILYVGTIGVLVYYFTVRCLIRGKRIITMLCLSGTMMMSFFCNYFSLLPNIECFVYSYIFDLLFMDSKYVIQYIGIKKYTIRQGSRRSA